MPSGGGYRRLRLSATETRDEHRVIVERALGRRLRRDETVHHKNGDKRDNRPENLEVLARAEHARLHAAERRRLGLPGSVVGSQSPNAKLDERSAAEVKRRLAAGEARRADCGSRTEWKKEDAANLWWRALAGCAPLRDFLFWRPDITVYAEVYGQVQDLRYGTAKGEVRLAVFDLLAGSRWLDAREARELAPNLPWVPTVVEGIPFDVDRILALAEGPSLIPGAGHVREGIVVKPLAERQDPAVGRVCLKAVGNGYLERP